MTREHLGLSLTLRIPVFIIVTKIDIATSENLQEIVSEVRFQLPCHL